MNILKWSAILYGIYVLSLVVSYLSYYRYTLREDQDS